MDGWNLGLRTLRGSPQTVKRPKLVLSPPGTGDTWACEFLSYVVFFFSCGLVEPSSCPTSRHGIRWIAGGRSWFPPAWAQGHPCTAAMRKKDNENLSVYFHVEWKLAIFSAHLKQFGERICAILYITSALKTSRVNPLKQLTTACWTSRPRPSIAFIALSRRPGLRAQNMWMFTARPSLILTSTYRKSRKKCKRKWATCSTCMNLIKGHKRMQKSVTLQFS